MKYVEYITTAAAQSAAFAGKVMETAFNYVGEIPEASGHATEIAANYLETAFNYVGEIPATAGQFSALAGECVGKIPAVSYETIDAIMDAASRAAESAGNMIENIPSYVTTLAGIATEYSAKAIAAAEEYLSHKEPEKSLNWLQVQDDGVYVNGDGRLTPNTPWPDDIPLTRPIRRRYPEGVPLVPPEPIPTGTPKVKKISPVTPPTGGCVNKRRPQPGQFCLRSWPYYGNIVELMWWDNIILRNTWYAHFDFDMHYEEHYLGTPLAMPTKTPPELVSDLPKGRYLITQETHNSSIENPYGIDYYSRYEGWSWELKFKDYPSQPHDEWTRSEMRTQANEWVECLGLKYGDSPIYYHFPGIVGEDAGMSCAGDGHAVGYTLGRMTMRYLSNDFPPVEETLTPAAYLPILGAVEALSMNIFNLLKVTRWGQ